MDETGSCTRPPAQPIASPCRSHRAPSIQLVAETDRLDLPRLVARTDVGGIVAGIIGQLHWAPSDLAAPDLCYHVKAMPNTAREQVRDQDAERERVLVLLRAHADDIRRRGVTRLALFGSTARGEAGPSSDVDLLIEVDPHARFTLVDLVGLERYLTGLLLRPVEFAFPSRLRERPRIWRRIRADAVDVL
jgi:predicted nucleotidyltransferase